MKKSIKMALATLALFGLTHTAFAATPGAYVGGGLGASMVEEFSDTNYFSLAGRLFAGYNFNHNFGLELGVAKYGQADADIASTVFNGYYFENYTGRVNYNAAAIDLVGKLYVFAENSPFNLYILGGAAYLKQDIKTKMYLADQQRTVKANSQVYALAPKFGLGMSYDIPQSNLTPSVEFSRIQQVNHSNNPNINMVTFNLAYNFN